MQNLHGLLTFLSLTHFLNTGVQSMQFVFELGSGAENKEEGKYGRQLQSNKRRYGYFQTGCLCVGLHKGNTDNGTNLRAQLCEEGNPAQLWRFDDNSKGGKLHSKANNTKCVYYRKYFRIDSRLRITDCNSKEKKLKFYHDGDSFGPMEKQGEGIGTDFDGSDAGAFLVLSEYGTSFDMRTSVDTSCPGPIINCPGQKETSYCDCSTDCTKKPRFCGCNKAKKCCEDNNDYANDQDDLVNNYGGNDYGGNDYGGNDYGGNDYGGNDYGGNDYGNYGY